MFNEKITNKLSVLTDSPGVYIMKDSYGSVIYVGKAKNLKNRVSQYFTGVSSHPLKVMKMVMNVDEFEYIVTDSELEALILENNLIKQYMPKYNILLKDDKTYPYIAISKKEPYPKFTLLRRRDNTDYYYFGPFSSSAIVWDIINTVSRLFGIYSCSKKFPRDFGKARPCLNYHIGNCSGVCTGKIDEQEYKQIIQKAIRFLKGDYKSILPELEEQMNICAENLDFEKAAQLRDKIKSIRKLDANQIIVFDPNVNKDIIAYSTLEDTVCFSVMLIRGGKLLLQDTRFVKNSEVGESIMQQFLQRYYFNSDRVPPEIVIDEPFDNIELITKWLESVRGGRVHIIAAKKGKNVQLLEMCRKNAMEKLAEKRANGIKYAKLQSQLAQLLKLKSLPDRIEMYDISNFKDDSIVAGMIVWQGGRFAKKQYKRFKLKDMSGQDDYKSMRQVIERRLIRLDNGDEGFDTKPDIIFVDGGTNHLMAVYDLLKERNISGFGLVKDRSHRTRAVVSIDGEVEIRHNPQLYKFFTTLQDEVHRFSISYMHKTKSKQMLNSELMKIEGLGSKRYKKLMQRFLNVKALSNADFDEICAVDGIPKNVASNIYNYFHKSED